MSILESNGPGRFKVVSQRQSKKNPIIQEADDNNVDPMSIVSTVVNYGVENARNHQRHLYDSLEHDNNLTLRLNDELDSAAENFDYINAWINRQEKEIKEYKEETRNGFKEMERIINKLSKQLNKRQDDADGDHAQLKKEVS
jgi:peptidoglycan hydrolase CwlO-like protein